MFTRLMRPHIHADLAPPHLLGFENYLNHYYAMNKRLPHSRVRVESASPGLLGLGII